MNVAGTLGGARGIVRTRDIWLASSTTIKKVYQSRESDETGGFPFAKREITTVVHANSGTVRMALKGV